MPYGAVWQTSINNNTETTQKASQRQELVKFLKLPAMTIKTTVAIDKKKSW
jgi:hypothetical protein